MTRVYLASPYSHPDPVVKHHRFRKAAKAAGLLIEAGYICFSPICHSHPIADEHGLPGNWEFWHQFDKAMIEWCDILVVLCIPGFDKSEGVKAEIALAQQLDRPVLYWHEGEAIPDVPRT